MLSPFQKEKLRFYFRFFDSKRNNFLVDDNIDDFLQKIYKFTKWSPTSTAAQELFEVHHTFYEVLKEKAGVDNDVGVSQLQLIEEFSKLLDKITLAEWLSLWETILPGCMGMHNCPVWIRLLPRSLFRIIDRKEDRVIDEEELCDFYREVVHLDPEEAKVTAKKGYNEMTDYGRYPLNEEGYEQIFANFLFGKTPYGPGRYIFGSFEHEFEETAFKLIQNAPDVECKGTETNRERSRSGMRLSATRRPNPVSSK